MSQSTEQSQVSQDSTSSIRSTQAVETPTAAPSAAKGDKDDTGAGPEESIRPESIRNVAGGVYNLDADQVAASVEPEALSGKDTDAQHSSNDASQSGDSSSR